MKWAARMRRLERNKCFNAPKIYDFIFLGFSVDKMLVCGEWMRLIYLGDNK